MSTGKRVNKLKKGGGTGSTQEDRDVEEMIKLGHSYLYSEGAVSFFWIKLFDWDVLVYSY